MRSRNETPTASEPILQIRDLRASFGGKRRVEALRGVSLDVAEGGFTALVGRSGSGKSVTVLAVLGLLNDPPGVTGGSIRYRGEALVPSPRKSPFDRVRGREIGLVLQDPFGALDPQMTVGSQMIETLERNRPEWPGQDLLGRSRDWLHRVGFQDASKVLDLHPGELSGGMAQRAMVALALCVEPSLLLADEPTSALDPTAAFQVLELIASLHRERRVAVLLVTHDIGPALRYASRVVVLSEGTVVEEGPVARFDPGNTDLAPEAAELLRVARDLH